MKQEKNLVTFIVGLVILFLMFRVFVGSDLFGGLFQPAVESGKLGAAPADVLATIAEMIFSVVSTVGIIGIMLATKVIGWITEAFGPMFGTQPKTVASVGKPANVISDSMASELYNLLIQSAIDGDKKLTVVVAEKIAGKAYLSDQLSTSFPENKR